LITTLPLNNPRIPLSVTMLLHVFVGDGQLVKPPEDLGSLRIVVSTSSGYGKGGREFDIGSNWTNGSFVRFHNTVVVGEADDATVGKLTFELKGTYKDDPAKEVTLGVAAIVTNPKQKSKTYVLELTPGKGVSNSFFSGGTKDTTSASICKLSITLFHNRFPVDLSPDEVALRHKQEMLASKEAKEKTKPSAREYSFLLNRKINWDKEDAASFNKDTEKKLDKDVVTNLKTLYDNKQSEKAIARESAARGRQAMRAPYQDSEPRLAYSATNSKRSTFIDISPHRPTALKTGFVGVSGLPSSPPRQGKGEILYRKAEVPKDPMEQIYNKMVLAEKRRLQKTAARAKKAHFQSSLDRAKSHIINQKAKESDEKDEMLRRMMERSDSQLKELRDEISRRKRRIAYLGLQKHISEEDARRKAKAEELEKARAEARKVLEEERVQALRESRSMSPRRSSLNDLPSWAEAAKLPKRSQSAQTRMPIPHGQNAIPLRKGPEPDKLREAREAANAAKKEQARREQEEETEVALIEAHNGPAGFHAENSFSRPSTSPSPARKPMPIERNRLPLRKADVVSQRAKAMLQQRKTEAENRAMALAAAQAAHERLRKKMKAQGRSPSIQGVIQNNPFPLREVPPGGTMASSSDTPSSKGRVYDFSQIGSAAKHALISEGEDAEFVNAGSNSGSNRSTPASYRGGNSGRKATPTNQYSFTMSDGHVLTSKTMTELEKMIADYKRKQETTRAKKVVKKKAGTIRGASKTVTSSHATGTFDRQGKKYATPVDKTKIFKKFYSPDYKVPDTSSQEETDAIVKEFNDAVGNYQQSSDNKGKSWHEGAEQSVNHLEALEKNRTAGIAMTNKAVDSYSGLMSKGDSLVAGEGGKITASKTPGFLSEYAEKDGTTAAAAAAGNGNGNSKKEKPPKGGKKKAAGAAAPSSTQAKNIADKLQKQADAEEKNKNSGSSDGSEKDLNLAALKQQLESQGVKVDDKMMELMASLQEETKDKQVSPAPKKSDAMAEMEAALHKDAGDEDDDDDAAVPAWGAA
jgi:hypothetical protein